ncbi:MAG: hypothetical protein ACYDBV_08290 [Nitrospiria bacterium]
MASFLRISFPLLGFLFFIFLFGCGHADPPIAADPFANLTGKSLGFDNDPPFFEPDASGREKGLDSAVPGTCGNIVLQWTNALDLVSSSSNITYNIYQAAVSGSENLNSSTYQTAPGVTHYLVRNLSPNTTYYFVVRAVDEAGNLSVIDPKNLVERSATIQGTRDKRTSAPNLYCPGGYAGESAVLTGSSVGNATTASFAGSLSLVSVPVTVISGSQIQAVIPSNIQSGPIQVNPGIGTTSDRFLYFPLPQNISKDSSSSTDPAMAVSGSNIAMVWTDSYNGTFAGSGHILFSQSTDGGQTFSFPPKILSDMNRSSSFPSIAYGAGGAIDVVWQDIEGVINNTDVYFIQSNDNGATFSSPVNLSDNAGNSISPKIAASGNAVSVVWQDNSVLYGLTSVWGSTLTDVYAAGRGGVIYHSTDQGNTWAKQTLGTATLNAIWGSSANDVYAVGTGGTILHFDGTAWSITSPTSNTMPDLKGIWGSSVNDVYAVGTGGTILHKDSSGWSAIPQASGTTKDLNGIWGSSVNDVYAVGTGGTILHKDSSGWSSTSQISGTTVNLNAIWGSGATDIYIAGDNGVILNSVGTGLWTSQPSFVTSGLNAIWGTTYIVPGTIVSTKVIYAGGVNGKIIKKTDTSQWDATSVASGGHFTINSLWGIVLYDSANIVDNIYAVEGDGPVSQWTGATWRHFPIEATQAEIFYRQSTNSGTSFSSPVFLSSASSAGHQALTPDIVYSGSNLTVAWAETLSGIHVTQSPDGISFSSPPVISPLQAVPPAYPKLAQWGSNVYLVWQDTSQVFNQIRMAQFPPTGLSVFPASQLLTFSSAGAASPSITVIGQNIVVVWTDQSQQKINNDVVQNEIFLISSPDGGASFTPPVDFSSPFPGASGNPLLVNNGAGIFMVWQQMNSPVGLLPQNNEIFFSLF